jgi:glucokinase
MTNAESSAVLDLPVSPETRLVIDVGGSTLRVVECDLNGKPLAQERYPQPVDLFPDLESGIATFLRKIGHRPALGVIGAAGPIEDGCRVRLTNAQRWPEFNTEHARQTLGVQMHLFNDLVVAAAGIPVLAASDLEPLRDAPGESNAPQLVITWSTGLNDAMILPEEYGPFRYIAGESGHIPFAARNTEEVELLQWAWQEQKYDIVGFEDVISGSRGFRFVYDYVVATSGLQPLVSTQAALDNGQRSAVVISDGATKHNDPVCMRAAEIIGGIAGTYFGSRAVSTVAKGGVYLIGGVSQDVPFIQFIVEHTAFLARFLDAGLMSDLTAHAPIYRVKHPDPGLLGAAEIARHLRE